MRFLSGFFLWAALPSSSAALSSGHVHDLSAGESASNAAVVITINPEARVSASKGKDPRPQACGTPVPLPIVILNGGFITAILDVRLVGDSANVALDYVSSPMTGKETEARLIHVTPSARGLTDVTLSFQLRNDVIDLGGRDHIHFLIDCY